MLFAFFILILTVRAAFFSPQFYKDLLVKNDLYNKIAETAPKSLTNMAIGDQDKKDLIFKESDIQNAVKNQFTASWLKENTEKTIDQTLNYIKGESQKIDMTVDLSKGLLPLVGITNLSAVSQLGSMRTCSPEEESKISQPNETTPTLNCLPSFLNKQDILSALASPKSAEKSFEVDLGSELQKSTPLETIKKFYSFSNPFYIGVIFILLSAIFYLVLRTSISGFAKRLAGILVFSLVIVALAAFGIKFALAKAISLSKLPGDISTVVSGVTDPVIKNFFDNLYVIGGVAVALIIILIVLSLVLKNKNLPTKN